MLCQSSRTHSFFPMRKHQQNLFLSSGCNAVRNPTQRTRILHLHLNQFFCQFFILQTDSPLHITS